MVEGPSDGRSVPQKFNRYVKCRDLSAILGC